MAQRGQGLREVLGRLRRPDQQAHRITASLRVDQCLELRRQLGVALGQLLASTTRSPYPLRSDLIGAVLPAITLHLTLTPRHSVWMRAGRARDRLHPTTTQLGSLST